MTMSFTFRRVPTSLLSLVAGSVAAMLFVAVAQAQFAGPGPNQPSVIPPTLILPATSSSESLVLLPGDLIEVQILGIPGFDYKARISDDGKVSLPLVGIIHVADESVIAAEQGIAQTLVSSELVRNPQVNLHILESPNHFVTVSGEVKTPGPIPLYGEKRLLDVISAAGGTTPASSPLLTIYRRGVAEPFQVLLPTDAAASARENIPIRPGDDIVVSKVGVVYILGAVHNQGAIPLKSTSPLTLLEAMSLAGGVNFEAALSKAYILRASPDGRLEIPFNVSAVIQHRVPDRILKADDIILLPTSAMKAALKGGAAGVAASLLAGVGYLTVR